MPHQPKLKPGNSYAAMVENLWRLLADGKPRAEARAIVLQLAEMDDFPRPPADDLPTFWYPTPAPVDAIELLMHYPPMRPGHTYAVMVWNTARLLAAGKTIQEAASIVFLHAGVTVFPPRPVDAPPVSDSDWDSIPPHPRYSAAPDDSLGYTAHTEIGLPTPG